jgi:guanine deaminase
MTQFRALRGPAPSFRGDPFMDPPSEALVHDSDAILLMEEGRIAAFGPAEALLRRLPPGVPMETFPSGMMMPGFIDSHVHFAQLGITGACGHGLLEWLEHFTFPEERKFSDPAYAQRVARLFLDELARQGTTTAAVYGTVHAASVDALFSEAQTAGLRIIAGKTMMDRNAPEGLLDTAQSSYDECRALIARWHGKGRLGYAVTPRFVATSTPEQMEVARVLREEFPGCWLQSHLSETTAEVNWVRQLFPRCIDYVDVLETHGLLGPRAIYGHGIHLTHRERMRLASTDSAIAHCPTSNLFLGSGLFDLASAKSIAGGIRVGLATDVGAGTSLSMLRTMGAAYEVARLRGANLAPAQALWLATGGGAQSLGLDMTIGNLRRGMDADIVVVDTSPVAWLDWRCRQARDAHDWLGALMTAADDRVVHAVYAAGRRVK